MLEETYQDLLATDCSPIHPRLLRLSRFEPCFGTGYFIRMHVGWGEGPRAFGKPSKSHKVGEWGFIKQQYCNLGNAKLCSNM